MSKVSELFETADEFEDLLSEAETEAKTGWEMDFVADMRTRYTTYGAEAFLSERQLELLEKIAGAE